MKNLMRNSVLVKVYAIVLILLLILSTGICQATSLLVGNYDGDNILSYNPNTGTFLGVFGSGGGLDGPTGITFGPDNNLYVLSSNTASILRYNGMTGQFINIFATFPAGTPSGWLTGPEFNSDIAFGPDGNLYATGGYIFNGTTGAFMDQLSPVNRFLTFGPDGNLYSSQPDLSVLEPGTGQLLYNNKSIMTNDISLGPDGRIYVAHDDADTIFTFDFVTGDRTPYWSLYDYITSPVYVGGSPAGIAFSPSGDLYVARSGGPTGGYILAFNGQNLALLDTFHSGPSLYGASDGGLTHPTQMVFTPNEPAPVPEPATMLLLGSGLVGLFGMRRKFKK